MEEMELQLVSMGFSQELATQALAATGAKSTLEATEWIFLHQQNPSLPTSFSPPTTPATTTTLLQPSLDRYFPSKMLLPPPPPQPQPPPQSSSSFPSTTNPHPPTTQYVTNPPKKHPKTLISEPLSDRMRPRTIDEVVGQDHLLGPNCILRSALDRDLLPSLVFWGPPGTGKTSIARAVANSTTAASSYRFVTLSAVSSGVKEVRDIIEEARRSVKKKLASGFAATTALRRTVLFVDEVHRFSRSQQDSFLPAIEDGSIVFMGATTENPSFHLTTPLLSRCRVLALKPLKPQHISTLLGRAKEDTERGLALSTSCHFPMEVHQEAIEFLSLHCDGDARVALNAMEVAATLAVNRESDSIYINLPAEGDGQTTVVVSVDDAKESLQCKHLAYDRAGEEHYNLISALHKSMRGSDVDAAIYWLARMLEGGEQPLYIARRLVRFASEDVGLGDPSALGHAIACYQACHFLGMPECNVNLAQCVAYLALAPKSVAVYRAIEAAQRVVRESGGGNEGVPLHLRNAPTKLMKDFGYGKDYLYSPNHPYASSQAYLPPSIQGKKFLEWPPPPELGKRD